MADVVIQFAKRLKILPGRLPQGLCQTPRRLLTFQHGRQGARFQRQCLSHRANAGFCLLLALSVPALVHLFVALVPTDKYA